MLVTLLGIVTLVRPEQNANACSSILVTLLGMVTLVNLVFNQRTHNPRCW